MDPPGQPWRWRLSRRFWGFPPFLALIETIALAVHFQDMDMVGQAIQQRPGQAFGAEHLRPLVEGQIAGRQDGAALVTLAEHLEQKFGAGFAERHEKNIEIIHGPRHASPRRVFAAGPRDPHEPKIRAGK